MVFDVALFQPLGLCTNRWLEIGGGSNWWYHPVWWMVATLLTWMGAWIQANQAAKTGSPSPARLVLGTIVLSLVCLALGELIGVPRAGWNLGSFAVAVLPAPRALDADQLDRRPAPLALSWFAGSSRFSGWLLTPLVAWAASFVGAWLGARSAGGLSTIR